MLKIIYSFLARLFEEKKSSYCRHSGVSFWVGEVFCQSLFLKNCQRYPFETWNTYSLSKEKQITTMQMTL
jgi:hypothetical protein